MSDFVVLCRKVGYNNLFDWGDCVELNIPLTRNRLFRGPVFPASHLAMALTKQPTTTPKINKKKQKLNLTKQTNPGLVASYDIQPGNGSDLFYNKPQQLPEPTRFEANIGYSNLLQNYSTAWPTLNSNIYRYFDILPDIRCWYPSLYTAFRAFYDCV